MEELINNDAQFELFSNSNGAMMLDRTLSSYPNEKTSFDIFLGSDGLMTKSSQNLIDDITKKNTESENKRNIDPEKIATGITAAASAGSSIASTVQAFKGDGTKPKSRRKQLIEVCGRKPVLKKNRGEYNKCVEQYNAGKIGGVTRTDDTSQPTQPTQPTDTSTPTSNTKKIVIGLVVVGLVVTAYIGYKKGWFGKK